MRLLVGGGGRPLLQTASSVEKQATDFVTLIFSSRHEALLSLGRELYAESGRGALCWPAVRTPSGELKFALERGIYLTPDLIAARWPTLTPGAPIFEHVSSYDPVTSMVVVIQVATAIYPPMATNNTLFVFSAVPPTPC